MPSCTGATGVNDVDGAPMHLRDATARLIAVTATRWPHGREPNTLGDIQARAVCNHPFEINSRHFSVSADRSTDRKHRLLKDRQPAAKQHEIVTNAEYTCR